jgi:PAS domain S-box-containing protein
MGRDVCLIALLEDDRLVVRGKAGRIRAEIDFGALLSGASGNPLTQALTERAPLLVLSLRDSDWAANPTVLALGVKSFISVPLTSYDQAIGTIFVGSNFLPTPFVPEDRDLFQILASQLGALSARAELEGDVRERATQLEALAAVSRTITAALRIEDVIRAVLANLRHVIPYDSVTLWLREGEQLRIAAAHGFENDAERLGLRVDIADSALFAEMAQTRGAILVPDVRADPRFPAGELQPTRTWLAAPLVSQDRIIGALALDKTEVNAYSQATMQVLLSFANQAAVALENARLFEDSARRSREVDERSQRLALLNRFSAELSGTLKLDHIFDITLEEVKRALNVPAVAVFQFSDHGQAALVRQSPPTDELPDLNNPVLQRVRETLAPLAVEDVEQDVMLAQARTGFLRRRVKSLLVLPLVVAGQAIAALQLEESVQRRFTPEEIELAQTLAYQAAVAAQNARLYDETQARLVELATFNQISQALTSTISLTDIYQTVAEQVSAVMGVENIYLGLYDEDRDLLSFPIFVERGQLIPTEPRAPGGLSAHVIRQRQPLLLRGDDISAQLAELGAGQIGPDAAKSFLAVPLITSDRVIGVIGVQDLDRANAFDYAHERLLTTIAAQVAVAIENARLYTEVQSRAIELGQRNERLAALNRLSSILSAASLNLDTILRQAAEQVTQLFRVDHSGVVLFDDTGALVEAEYPEIGLVGTHLPIADNPLQVELLTTRRPVAVHEVAADPRLSPPMRDNLSALGIRSTLFVPFVSQGEAIGSFSLDAIRAPRRFTDDEIELCQIIAAQIAVAVENARFTQELESRVAARTRDVERERERVETLLQITTELASNLELDRVLQRALQLVTEAVNAPRGSVFLQDFSSDQLIYRAALGRPKPLPPGGQPAPFKWNEGLVGWVMKNRQAVVISDLEHDPRWKHLPDSPTTHKSALAVPLMSSGDALGAMVLLSPDYDAFDEDQLRLVSAAADRVGDAINNAELYRLIREQAEKLGSLLRGQQVEATKSRAILEGIADGVLVTDPAGQIILLNAACEKLLGLKASEVLKRPITEYVGLYGAAGKTWIDASARWSEDPGSYQLGEFLEERIELEDKRVLSIHLSPVTANEEYLGAVSLIRDITRDVEVDRLKSEFVTNVSHELRTPMTSIKGYADILLMGAAGSLNEHQSRFIEVIKNNADRLSILVNDLLDISRIESGRVQLERRALHLREVVQAVIDNLRGRIDEEHKPIRIVADLPADLPQVWADRERVTQIITNLADNAFNYSNSDSVMTLTASVVPERAEVVLEVTDTGVGIAPEDQPRLFDRFYRGEDALVLATPGTGLGLPIARQLAEMHGGRLWLARSELGKGSTFALALPLAKE